MIPIAKPYLDQRESDAVGRVIATGWITQGPEIAAFEREFAECVGAEFACAVSNCTTGLHLALLAAGVGPGDEVITVSHSFIATSNCIRYCGATPVFVDISPETYNIRPEAIMEAITPATRAIICVHQMGMPCDLAKVLVVARRYGIPLIEDAACAIGSQIFWNGKWESIGSPHGDAACFSFHPRKILTTGDGGMITTRHRQWDEQFRLMRQHGMSVPDTVRHGSSRVIFEKYPELGYNYRMTDIQGAIGREQLKRLPVLIARRRQLAERYAELLEGLEGVSVPQEPEWARSNWQSYCCRLEEWISQVDVMQALLDRGIASRRGIMCAHKEGAYGDLQWRSESLLEESVKAQEQCLLLPLFHQLSDADQIFIAAELRDIVSRHSTAKVA